MKKSCCHLWCPTTLFVLAVVCDRLTKWLALNVLSSTPHSVCYGFNLLLSWNRGVSWSMLTPTRASGYVVLLLAIGAVIITFAGYTIMRFIRHEAIGWEALVLGGALSNFIDRLWYGAVIDFIEVYVVNFHWPVFNIADACIFVGVCGMLLRTWRSSHE
jgi:signal peptidase II